MKLFRNIALVAALLSGAAGAFAQTPQALQAPEQPDSITAAAAVFISSNINRGVGMVFENLRDMGLEIDSAQVIALVRERVGMPYDEVAHANSGTILTEAAGRMSLQREAQFLAAAAARPGAEDIGEGVILEVLQSGEGPAVQPTDTVTFNYTGRLPSGKVFDDSFAENRPLVSQASELVRGMTLGLGHMSKGGMYRLSIPSALAYGSRGAGGVIPPDTPLEFTIQVIDINQAQQ